MFEKAVGTIGWLDLTVDRAEEVRDFYHDVVGWTSTGVEMGGYNDFCMHPSEGEAPVAGICHARGPNAEIPPVWLVYFNVGDLDNSIDRCVRLGGNIISARRDVGSGWMAIISDPSGATCGLFQLK